MTASETKKAPGGTAQWVAVHLVGSIIFVLGALYVFVDMRLIDALPTSSFQAWTMMAVGLVLDFWGVIEMRRIQLARKAAKE
ncbi:MAG: hypothetical protein KDE68_01145 [Rhodocyclaceae bacterium]|nr:hypothetical protein [Rhodocyclaceae bacterium]